MPINDILKLNSQTLKYDWQVYLESPRSFCQFSSHQIIAEIGLWSAYQLLRSIHIILWTGRFLSDVSVSAVEGNVFRHTDL